MPRLSRAVYVLFVLSATLFLVLARPVTDSQLEKTTTNAGQVPAHTLRLFFPSDTCE